MASKTPTAQDSFPTDLSSTTTDPTALMDQIATSITAANNTAGAVAGQKNNLLVAMKAGQIWTGAKGNGHYYSHEDLAASCKNAGKQPGTGSLIAMKGIQAGTAIGGGIAGSAISTGVLGLEAGTLAAGAATAAFTAGIGLAVAAIVSIEAHHKQAVKREDAFICQYVPQINNSITAILAAWNGGQIKATDMAMLFAQLFQATKSALSSIQKPCNAACLIAQEIKAIGLFNCTAARQLEAANKAPWQTGSANAAAGTTGVSSAGGVLAAAAAVAAAAVVAH